MKTNERQFTIELLKLLGERTIGFHPSFARVAGGATAGLFLSQAWFWSTTPGVMEKMDGWFYKTMAEWTEETNLSRREQESARRKLRTLGVLEEKQDFKDRKLWFKINVDKLLDLLRSEINSQPTKCAKRTYRNAQNVHFVNRQIRAQK